MPISYSLKNLQQYNKFKSYPQPSTYYSRNHLQKLPNRFHNHQEDAGTILQRVRDRNWDKLPDEISEQSWEKRTSSLRFCEVCAHLTFLVPIIYINRLRDQTKTGDGWENWAASVAFWFCVGVPNTQGNAPNLRCWNSLVTWPDPAGHHKHPRQI